MAFYDNWIDPNGVIGSVLESGSNPALSNVAIFAVHAAGGNSTKVMGWMQQAVSRSGRSDVAIIVPDALSGRWFTGTYENVTMDDAPLLDSLESLQSAINYLVVRSNGALDYSKIVLVGYGQGASVVSELISRYICAPTIDPLIGLYLGDIPLYLGDMPLYLSYLTSEDTGAETCGTYKYQAVAMLNGPALAIVNHDHSYAIADVSNQPMYIAGNVNSESVLIRYMWDTNTYYNELDAEVIYQQFTEPGIGNNVDNINTLDIDAIVKLINYPPFTGDMTAPFNPDSSYRTRVMTIEYLHYQDQDVYELLGYPYERTRTR